MAKTKRLVTITAGRLVFALCYTQAMSYDTPKDRSKKTKHSSEARRRINFRYAYQKCQLKLATNFCKNDWYITLTYDDAHLPGKRKAADKLVGKFLRQLKEARKKTGDVLKWIRSTHELAGEDGRRLHHHIVLNAVNEYTDIEQIESLWTYGNVHIQRIGQSEHYLNEDFLELAMYLTGERNPDKTGTTPGSRSWSGSHNLSKPIRESILVEETMTVEAPPGAYILDTDERRNEYGTFKYIKYLLPERRSTVKKPLNRRRE